MCKESKILGAREENKNYTENPKLIFYMMSIFMCGISLFVVIGENVTKVFHRLTIERKRRQGAQSHMQKRKYDIFFCCCCCCSRGRRQISQNNRNKSKFSAIFVGNVLLIRASYGEPIKKICPMRI